MNRRRLIEIICPLLFYSNMNGRPIQVHGHRGARAVLPENTLPAFEYAIEQGVDAIEMDIAVTRDDVLVVSHDPVLNPEICRSRGGSRVIRELTLEELKRWDCGSLVNPRYPRQTPVPGARIPSLDEILALAGCGRFLFNIELKISPQTPQYTPAPERFAELVLAAIDRHGLRSRAMVQSFDFRPLRALKATAPGIPIAALDEDENLGDFVAVAQGAGAGIIAPHKSMVTQERVAGAHQAGLQVIVWTANTPQEWDALVAAGVDGIISDDPAALIDYLKQSKLR